MKCHGTIFKALQSHVSLQAAAHVTLGCQWLAGTNLSGLPEFDRLTVFQIIPKGFSSSFQQTTFLPADDV